MHCVDETQSFAYTALGQRLFYLRCQVDKCPPCRRVECQYFSK